MHLSKIAARCCSAALIAIAAVANTASAQLDPGDSRAGAKAIDEVNERGQDAGTIVSAYRQALAKRLGAAAAKEIEATFLDGVLTLTGRVANKENKDAAEQIAKETAGVTKTNNLIWVQAVGFEIQKQETPEAQHQQAQAATQGR